MSDWAKEMDKDMDEHPEWFGMVKDEMGNSVEPAGELDMLKDAVAAMASVLVLAERDGMWPYYTAIARRAYDAAGGTLAPQSGRIST